jgi:hypothetical protein
VPSVATLQAVVSVSGAVQVPVPIAFWTTVRLCVLLPSTHLP